MGRGSSGLKIGCGIFSTFTRARLYYNLVLNLGSKLLSLDDGIEMLRAVLLRFYLFWIILLKHLPELDQIIFFLRIAPFPAQPADPPGLVNPLEHDNHLGFRLHGLLLLLAKIKIRDGNNEAVLEFGEGHEIVSFLY